MLMKSVRCFFENESFDFLAFPCKDLSIPYDYQWYWTKAPYLIGKPIENANDEVYSITVKEIQRQGYEESYIYCERLNRNTGQKSRTEVCRFLKDTVLWKPNGGSRDGDFAMVRRRTSSNKTIETSDCEKETGVC